MSIVILWTYCVYIYMYIDRYYYIVSSYFSRAGYLRDSPHRVTAAVTRKRYRPWDTTAIHDGFLAAIYLIFKKKSILIENTLWIPIYWIYSSHQLRPFLLFFLHKCIHAYMLGCRALYIHLCVWLLFMFMTFFWCLSIRGQVQVVVYPLAWLTRFAALSPVHNSIVEYTFAAMLNCLSCAHSHFDFKVDQSAYSCYLHAGHVGQVRLPEPGSARNPQIVQRETMGQSKTWLPVKCRFYPSTVCLDFHPTQ